MSTAESQEFRSGFIGIIGKPNVGKSTLLNRILGQKIAITSPKPQTTRTRILGVLNRPGAQALFLDSPGWHKPKAETLGQIMMRTSHQVLDEADVVVVMIDATSGIRAEDQYVFDSVRTSKRPAILVINKADAVKKPLILPILEQAAAKNLFQELVPISAKTGEGVEDLLKLLIKRLPEGPQWYEPGQVSDQPQEQLIREFIREQILAATRQEVPYAAAVLLEQIEVKDKVTVINAKIIVERDGQKAILIGKGGETMKAIGRQARHELEQLLGRKVYLELWVKVEEKWREDPEMLRELGYAAE